MNHENKTEVFIFKYVNRANRDNSVNMNAQLLIYTAYDSLLCIIFTALGLPSTVYLCSKSNAILLF